MALMNTKDPEDINEDTWKLEPSLETNMSENIIKAPPSHMLEEIESQNGVIFPLFKQNGDIFPLF